MVEVVELIAEGGELLGVGGVGVAGGGDFGELGSVAEGLDLGEDELEFKFFVGGVEEHALGGAGGGIASGEFAGG